MVMLTNTEPNKQTLLLCVPIAVKGNCAGFTNPVIRVIFQQSSSTRLLVACVCWRVDGEGEVHIDLCVVTPQDETCDKLQGEDVVGYRSVQKVVKLR